jgi:hypothetical protein
MRAFNFVITMDIISSLLYVVFFLMGDLQNQKFTAFLKIEIVKIILMAL